MYIFRYLSLQRKLSTPTLFAIIMGKKQAGENTKKVSGNVKVRDDFTML